LAAKKSLVKTRNMIHKGPKLIKLPKEVIEKISSVERTNPEPFHPRTTNTKAPRIGNPRFP